MAHPRGDIDELARCSGCGRAFDDATHEPKLLACHHHFCLRCVRPVGPARDVICAHCRKRTVLPGGLAERLPTHAPVLALARRLYLTPPAPFTPPSSDSHSPNSTYSSPDAQALVLRDARALHADLCRLAARRRDVLLDVLDATTALKMQLEAELAAPAPDLASPPAADCPSSLAAELERLRISHGAASVHARLDEVVRRADAPLDFERLRHAARGDAASESGDSGGARDPLLLVANYCTAASFMRGLGAGVSPARPLIYLELTVDGTPAGRVVVALRPDAAPRMARNFAALAGGARGVGYAGCSVFQVWEGESVIAGDVERNDGRGGRSMFAAGHFAPDESRLAAVRGAVGMRRGRRRHERAGLVASQFRIVLREMRGFTAIFGAVVEGLALLDALSRAGDGAGRPHNEILIASCGRLR